MGRRTFVRFLAALAFLLDRGHLLPNRRHLSLDRGHLLLDRFYRFGYHYCCRQRLVLWFWWLWVLDRRLAHCHLACEVGAVLERQARHPHVAAYDRWLSSVRHDLVGSHRATDL